MNISPVIQYAPDPTGKHVVKELVYRPSGNFNPTYELLDTLTHEEFIALKVGRVEDLPFTHGNVLPSYTFNEFAALSPMPVGIAHEVEGGVVILPLTGRLPAPAVPKHECRPDCPPDYLTREELETMMNAALLVDIPLHRRLVPHFKAKFTDGLDGEGYDELWFSLDGHDPKWVKDIAPQVPQRYLPERSLLPAQPATAAADYSVSFQLPKPSKPLYGVVKESKFTIDTSLNSENVPFKPTSPIVRAWRKVSRISFRRSSI